MPLAHSVPADQPGTTQLPGPHHSDATAAARGYHHGNLPEALVEAGLELARAGGPDAVVLREAARRVGVSPTAAYRHFAGQSDLLDQVKERALAVLSTQMVASLDAVGAEPTSSSLQAASVRLRAIGEAYLRFALDEPGLFRTFCIGLPMPEGVGFDGDTPAFGVLSQIMGELAAAGGLDAEHAPTAALAAWSAVHGLATLCMDGPLAELGDLEREALFEATFDMVLHGLIRSA